MDRRADGWSDSSTIAPASGNAAPSLQPGNRPRVSESNAARVGARMTRMGRSGNGPTPGNGAASSAAWASSTATACCDVQATAVTRPPVGGTVGRVTAVATPDLGARRLLSLEREGQSVLTLLAP